MIFQKISADEKSICDKCFHHGICMYEDNQPCFECTQFADAVPVIHGHKAESVISKTGLMCTACYSDIDRDAVFCKYCGALMDLEVN